MAEVIEYLEKMLEEETNKNGKILQEIERVNQEYDELKEEYDEKIFIIKEMVEKKEQNKRYICLWDLLD